MLVLTIVSNVPSVEKGEAVSVEFDSLTRQLLDTHKCYILDCGKEVFVWMGRSSSLNQRKAATSAVDELLRSSDRSNSYVIRVIEGFETVIFRSKFDSWPQITNVAVTEDGRGKVAALLKRQGVNVKGLLKAESPKEEHQLFIDCTGDLQVMCKQDLVLCMIGGLLEDIVLRNSEKCELVFGVEKKPSGKLF